MNCFMFGLMKERRGTGGDMNCVSGSVLGANTARPMGGLDVMSKSLVQLCSFALPRMSGATMTSLESVLRIEMYKKPELRTYIAECYAERPSLGRTVRGFKRQLPRHADSYRLALSLCHVARAANCSDRQTLARVIKVSKALGLSKEEVLAVLQKARLAA